MIKHGAKAPVPLVPYGTIWEQKCQNATPTNCSQTFSGLNFLLNVPHKNTFWILNFCKWKFNNFFCSMGPNGSKNFIALRLSHTSHPKVFKLVLNSPSHGPNKITLSNFEILNFLSLMFFFEDFKFTIVPYAGLYMGPNNLCCVALHFLLFFSVSHVTFYKNFTSSRHFL